MIATSRLLVCLCCKPLTLSELDGVEAIAAVMASCVDFKIGRSGEFQREGASAKNDEIYPPVLQLRATISRNLPSQRAIHHHTNLDASFADSIWPGTGFESMRLMQKGQDKMLPISFWPLPTL
jgi:hypothetical protein